MSKEIIRSIKMNHIKNLKKIIRENNDITYNKNFYEVALNKNNYEAIEILCESDNRGEEIILDDLFHLIYDGNKTISLQNKSLFMQKIKNKELKVSIIDEDFLYNINHINEIKSEVISLIKNNELHSLNNCLKKKKTLISYLNDENFDLLIHLIQNNFSIDVIKNIISYYKSLNYVVNEISPILYAVFTKKFSIAKLLLQHGADIDYKINNDDIISIFFNKFYDEKYERRCFKRVYDKEILNFILSHTRIINSSKVNNWIIRMIKINDYYSVKFLKMVINYYKSNIDNSLIMKLLIIYKNKLKLNNKQFYNVFNGIWYIPVEWLNCAIDFNNLEIIKYFIDCEVNLNGVSANGDSPLYKTLKRGKSLKSNDQYIIKCLEGKCDPNKIFKNGETPLNYAIQHCFDHVINSLINNGANIHEKSFNGNTPLINAVKMNNMRLIKYLVRHKVDINAENQNGETPLSIAVKYYNHEVVKYLIDKKVNINKKNKYGKTALDIAIEEICYYYETIKYLMDENAKISNYSCLALAIEKNFDKSIIIYLIEHGADINKKNSIGKTPLDISIGNCEEEITEYLIDCGAEVSDPFCLVNAIEMKFNEKTIKYLINKNIDVNKKNVDGISPLIFLIMRKQDDLIKYLIDSGAKLMNDKINEESPLTFMIKNNFDVQIIKYVIENGLGISVEKYLNSEHLNIAINMDNIELIEYFIGKGIDINKDSKLYGTPLINAIRNKNENMIKLLIKYGADLNRKSKIYGTPLINAIENLSGPFIKYLIEQGANVNICYHQNSPLSYVIFNYSEEMAYYFIDHGATNYSGILLSTVIEKKYCEKFITNLIDHGVELNGNSVLVKLLKNNYGDNMIKYVIGKGADPNEKDENGILPIMMAIQKNRKTIIKYLIDHGAIIDELNEETKLLIVSQIEQENEKILKFFYDKKIINVGNRFTPMYGKNFRESIIKFLVENNKEINISEYLEEAIKNKYSDDVIKTLIKYSTNDKINNFDQLLYYAIKNIYSDEIIEMLLEKCIKINNPSILRIAIENYSDEIINSIIKHGANLNMKDNSTRSFLDLAMEKCSESVINVLINQGVTVSKDTPLINAIEKKYSEKIIYYLVKKGININNGPIIAKLIENKYSNNIIKMVIIKGADINKENEKGETPLILSVLNNNIDIIKCLIKNGADVNKVGPYSKPPILYAFENNNELIIRDLINHGASIEHLNSNDYCLVINTVKNNNYVFECLFDKVLNIFENEGFFMLCFEKACEKNYYNILGYIIYKMIICTKFQLRALNYAIENQKINLVKYLINKNFESDYQSSKYVVNTNNIELVKFFFVRIKSYCPYLTDLIEEKNPEMLESVVNYIIPLNIEHFIIALSGSNNFFLTKHLNQISSLYRGNQEKFLIMCGKLKKYDLVLELVNHGITINGKGKFYSFLYFAINYSFGIIDYLLKEVMNINDVNEDKETLLIVILSEGKKTKRKSMLIKRLIDLGADVNSRSMYGEHALSLAKQNSNKAIVNYMIKHGALE